MIKIILILSLLFLFWGCKSSIKIVPFNDPSISYEGRILYKTDAAELSWPGTSATIQFEGTEVSAILKDLDTANYYNAIVDNNVVSRFHTDTIKQSYLLASGLSKGKHTIQLFKRTEWDKGKTLFYGFESKEGFLRILSPVSKKRKIEFYGNSITCGYANEDNSGQDRWFGYYQNNYETYAAITARHFNATYFNNSKSGIGILVSWFPFIMPEIFDRTDPVDSTSKWDFSKYTPDIVVVNLFQNDSWLVSMPESEHFKHQFGIKKPDEATIIEAYKKFVATIRSKYPNASIICSLGNMDATREGSAWPGYIQKAVDELNDRKIYTHFFPYKNTGGHPNVEEQKIMAKSLIEFIEKYIRW